MNTLQRLLSNTLLALVSTAMVKVSNSILFIMIGRSIGPENAGGFGLGIAYFTIVFALSSWGLHELLVREAAPRRQESGRYFVNFLAMRVVLACFFYGVLLLFLHLNLPYTDETQVVIRIIGVAAISEAIFSICQALFSAHEQLLVPTVGSFLNSIVTIGIGVWFLQKGGGVGSIAWAIPIGSFAGLTVFPPSIIWLFRKFPQTVSMKLSWHFSREQLSAIPSFILLDIFSTLSFQADTLIISLFMGKADLGYYGAAQMILMGFVMMPMAIRMALYPLMARYKEESITKLNLLYHKANQYLWIGALPIAMGITLLADPVIQLIFGVSFEPAVPALQWSIWAIPFLLMTVPSARLMLVYHYQQSAGWIRGFGMIVSVVLNLWLIPHYGIVGASIARVLVSITYFGLLYWFVRANIEKEDFMAWILRPIIAVLIMTVIVCPFRQMFLLWPIIVGVTAYSTSLYFLRVITPEDRYYVKQLFS